MMEQATKPQTIGLALADSPLGFAAWVVEKFHGWGDTGGDIERRFSKDELQTNIMLYLGNDAVQSSIRMYRGILTERAAGPGWRRRRRAPSITPNSCPIRPARRPGLQRRAVDQHAVWRPFRRHGRAGSLRPRGGRVFRRPVAPSHPTTDQRKRLTKKRRSVISIIVINRSRSRRKTRMGLDRPLWPLRLSQQSDGGKADDQPNADGPECIRIS